MGTIECSQPASKSSWDSQDFGDISMVLKMAYFRKSPGPRWVNDEIYVASRLRHIVMRSHIISFTNLNRMLMHQRAHI